MRDGIEIKIDSTEFDMKERMRGTLIWFSNSPSLYYETLLSPGTKHHPSFSFRTCSGPLHGTIDRAMDDPIGWRFPTIFPTDSTSLESPAGFQSFSIQS
jgi:hypothetical protein